MRRLMLLAALIGTPAFAQAPPVANRANAAVSGSPNILLSGASAQADLCTAVLTGAYGSPVLGVTFNLAHRDRQCARIRMAKALQLLGREAAAVQVLCLEDDVRAAMAAAGTPCERQRDPQ